MGLLLEPSLRDRITWVLPVGFQAQFKVLELMFKALNTLTRVSKGLSSPTKVYLVTKVVWEELSAHATIIQNLMGGYVRDVLHPGSIMPPELSPEERTTWLVP